MKILFCLNSASEFAGVQQYILSLVTALQKEGIHAIVWLNENAAFETKLSEHGISFYQYQESIYSLKNLWKLTTLIKKEKIKIIHANLGGAAIASAIVKRISGIKKFIYTQHFINPASSQGSIIKRLVSKLVFKVVLLNVDYVIAISNEVKRSILNRKEVSERKIKLIYNGIIAVSGETQASVIPNILIVSRLEHEKGVDKLLPIFWKLLQNGYDFSVTIVGGGSQEKVLKDMANSLELDPRIKFIGKVKDVSPYYLKASVYLNPTMYEGFGLAIVEAMSAKLPVIAFNKGGPVDIVVNERTGYLVESYDAFGTGIEQLLRKPALLEAFGSAGYERFNKLFTADVMLNKLMVLYEGIV